MDNAADCVGKVLKGNTFATRISINFNQDVYYVVDFDNTNDNKKQKSLISLIKKIISFGNGMLNFLITEFDNKERLR